MNLTDDRHFIFQFSGFEGTIQGNFYYLSDPQIFLDMGYFEF